jgi:hypothetical protein
MRLFNPTSTQPARAVQAWQILVGHAMNRQTITYLELSRLMFAKAAAGVLDHILGHIAYYCQDNKLPPLTSIVVGKASGIPGEGIPVDLSQISTRQAEVYKYDWYNVYPPSEGELKLAYDAHR